MKACAYARVSTDQKEQTNSFENQQEYFERVIKAKGYEYIGTYSDRETGTIADKRTGFQQLLYDAGINKEIVYTPTKTGKNKKHEVYYPSPDRDSLFDEIWIKNTSRFFRNTILSSTIINVLAEKKVYIYFESQNLNTKDVSSEVFIKLLSIFDEEESRDKSQKVRWGHQRGIERGIISSNSKLFGYEYIAKENKLKIIPHEADIVKTIFEMYESGIGIRRIINTLTSKRLFTRAGKPFGKTTVAKILRNEKYAGLNNRGKYDTGIVFNKNTYPKVKEQYDVKSSDKIEQIIPEELFYRCQEILDSNINHIEQKGKYKGLSEYVGLIYCRQCGEVYTSNVDKGRHFYNCKTKKQNGIKACNNPNVSKKYIDESIEELANGGYYLDVIEDRDVDIYRLNTLKCHLIDTLDADLSDLVLKQKEELDQLINENRKYASMFAKGQIDEAFFNEQHEELQKQIDNLEFEIANNSKTNKDIIEDISVIEHSIQQLMELDIKYQYKKEEIMNEIEKIIVGVHPGDGNISLTFEYKALNSINSITEKYEDLLDKTGDIDYTQELFEIKENRLEEIRNGTAS